MKNTTKKNRHEIKFKKSLTLYVIWIYVLDINIIWIMDIRMENKQVFIYKEKGVYISVKA